MNEPCFTSQLSYNEIEMNDPIHKMILKNNSKSNCYVFESAAPVGHPRRG